MKKYRIIIVTLCILFIMIGMYSCLKPWNTANITSSQVINISNIEKLSQAEKIFLNSINIENWYSGSQSTLWQLNNKGKVKCNFYYDNLSQNFAIVPNMKINKNNIDYYFYYRTIKDEWGYGEGFGLATFEKKEELEKDVNSNFSEYIGNKVVNIPSVTKPNYGAITQEKQKIFDKIKTYVINNLRHEGKKGKYNVYIENFNINRPSNSFIIEGKDEYSLSYCQISQNGEVDVINKSKIDNTNTFFANRVKESSIKITIDL